MKKYVCIVGGANIDICGKSRGRVKGFDSNPGRVTVSLGGVGRNIAENLARMGDQAVMITVLGDDMNAKLLEKNGAEVGIDFSHSLKIEGANSTTYLCLMDCDGEMYVGLSDMELLDFLTPQYLEKKLDVLNSAAAIVFDTNVPQCFEFLKKHATAPLFLDTVSANKTRMISGDLKNVFCVKPNVLEAEVLAGFEIKSDGDIKRAMVEIHKKGAKWVVVTCGSKGVWFSDGKNVGQMPSLCKNVVNATGAGDSFLAGLVHGYLKGLSLAECVAMGSRASKVTLESLETVAREMSKEVIDE